MKKLLIILFIFIVVFVIYIFLSNGKSRTTPLVLSSFVDIKPGFSTREDIEKNLGKPISNMAIDGGSISKYRSDNQYWTNDIYFDGNISRLTISKILPPQNTSLSKKTVSLGEQPVALYGPGTHIGILLYVYPKTGIAFLANKEQDIVYEEWKFAPTEIATFLSFPEAKGFTIEKTGGKPEL